jgi:hypothetical protein
MASQVFIQIQRLNPARYFFNVCSGCSKGIFEILKAESGFAVPSSHTSQNVAMLLSLKSSSV